MSAQSQALELRTSPHFHRPLSTPVIMGNVAGALAPVAAFAFYAFGLSALLLILTTTAAAVLTEYVIARAAGRERTVNDFSAVVTGLLLGLTLPPAFPLWMAAVGGVVAIGMGKALFGGLGFNVFNPALVGRAFLMAAFPQAITRYTPAFMPGRFATFIPSTLTAPFLQPRSLEAYLQAAADAWTGATPLAQVSTEQQYASAVSLFTGTISGSAGETAAWLILLCGAYLAARRMLDWRIPAGMLGSVFVFSLLFYLSDTEKYPPPLFMLFSGGLMLGAVFMATDMVSSPVTNRGIWIYGVLLGLLTVLIRLKGGLPEGVMYAILLGNAITPLLNYFTQPRVLGARKTADQES